jgi:hypothetical protein
MKRFAVAITVALFLSGCGGSRKASLSATTTPITTSTAAPGSTTSEGKTTKQTRATLRGAVRAALAGNHHLAIKVLWTNHIPATARRSTRGPALAELTASAKDRQKKGIRVRMVRDNYRIIWIHISAVKTTATALAAWDQRVVPSHRDGTPLGRAVSLHERARLELRRMVGAQAFVVWKATLVK